MKSTSGRVIVAACLLVSLGGLIAYLVVATGGAKAAGQALSDTGKFKVGSALGQERAGFSGRAMVQVFTASNAPDWPRVSTCLQSAAVDAEMSAFVGVLVDLQVEPTIEAVYRQRDGLQVIVRGLDGAFLGSVPAGFTCNELVDLLRAVTANSSRAIEKSPIYNALLTSADPINYLKAGGERVRAARYVDFLKEFEGENSQAAVAAEARLNQ